MNHTDNDNPLASVKAQWRRRMKAGRAAISAQQQVTEAAAMTGAVAGVEAGTVCCYVPYGSEPGSIALLDMLRDRGSRVLLPVIPDGRGPLDWAEYTGTSTLVTGAFPPVLEPGGPRLGPRALAEADVVLVPALAVDREGVRLGKGAGYYDRSLVFASPRTDLIAVVRDTELVEKLPAEPHDVRMHAVLTPEKGVLRLPAPNAV